MLEIIIDILALIVLFFLPGFFLVLIIFPNRGQLSKDFDLIFKICLSIALSAAISIIAGLLASFFGIFSGPLDTKSIRLWIVMILVTFWLGVFSWKFGGLKAFFAFEKEPSDIAIESKEDELRQLVLEKKRLQEKLAILMSKHYQTDKTLKEEASVRIPGLKKQIEEINIRIDELVEQNKKSKEAES